jgi:hypothetical protein
MTLPASGDDCLDGGGEGVGPLVNELALSTTDGDLDGSRVLALRTAKKVEAGRSLGAASAVAVLPDSFSSALIRCEMLDPSLALLGRRSAAVCCAELFCREGAPDEADLAAPAAASPGAKKEFRTGLETVRVKRGAVKFSGPPVALLEFWSREKNGDMGDFDTVIGVASCTVADCSSSMKPSLSRMLITDRRLSLSAASRSVRIGSGNCRFLDSFPAVSAISSAASVLSFGGTGGGEFPARHESTFEVSATFEGILWLAEPTGDFVSWVVANLERGIGSCGDAGFSSGARPASAGSVSASTGRETGAGCAAVSGAAASLVLSPCTVDGAGTSEDGGIGEDSATVCLTSSSEVAGSFDSVLLSAVTGGSFRMPRSPSAAVIVTTDCLSGKPESISSVFSAEGEVSSGVDAARSLS